MDAHLSNIQDVNNFLQVLSGSTWGMSFHMETIDNLFQCALHLQKNTFPELMKKYPGIDFSNPLDLLLESIIKNHHIDEHITLYAIKKYLNLPISNNLVTVLDGIVAEADIREQLFNLIKDVPNVDLDFCKMNRLLQDLDCPNCDSKITNAVKFETGALLDAFLHCSDLTGPVLINKLIHCLECQTDLRLWFTLFKNENIENVVKLCSRYNSFLDAILVFFDKFSEEVESTYDEDLNVKYSHVNLDFEDFVKIFQLFLKNKSLHKIIQGYLDRKTILDKNYCFWIDLKSCIEN